MDFQKIVNRAKNIITSPKTEWPIIAAEPATVSSLYTDYAMILAAIPAIAGLIGNMLFGLGPVAGLITAVLGYVLGLVVLYLMALIIDALAPSFGGSKNIVQSLKLVVYSSTPVWVVGILGIFPPLALLSLVALIYGIYVMYLGVPHCTKAPADRAGGFTAVIVIAWIVLTFVIAMVIGVVVAAILGPAAMMSMGR